ncbi:MAG: DUF664 domain-containing protein [Chloroflexi bacterium]|nr:MAG: DUF664 domain-containing protein [Chloroflexota bacterium]
MASPPTATKSIPDYIQGMDARLIDFYFGWEKHNRLLIAAIEPLNSEKLDLSAAPGLWSVRRLANHIVAVRSWWFNANMGEGQEELARFADFDDVEDADTHDAKVIVEGLRSTWSSMAGCLKKWTADDLGEQFQRPEPNREGERPWRTRQYIVWHVAEHDVHHGGEISLTLGMHGLPGLDL